MWSRWLTPFLCLASLAPAGRPLRAAPAPAGRPQPTLTLDGVLLVLDNTESRIRELETTVAQKSRDAAPEEVAQRRVTDALVLYNLKNYEGAATILFDVVETYPKSPSYPEALFYLSDSLYQKRDYLAAQRYFTRLVEQVPSHPRYQEALLRLCEIAFHLKSYEQADRWMDKLAQLPSLRTLAQVPYVRGKYYFLKRDHERALAELLPILPLSPYYFQARYLIGASHVAEGKLQEAIGDFALLGRQGPRTDDERRILELSHLALGRIYYEQGQTIRAQQEYLQISQKSDLFPDALYEGAWVAIKAKEFKRAQRQLELLVLSQPEALGTPEARLLIGNLQTRLNEFQSATGWFKKTREEFEPVHKQLQELLSQNTDLAGYFRALVDKNLSKFDAVAAVGKTAARYLRGEPDVERFSTLATDVAELRRSLADAEDAIVHMEKAMAGPQRYNVAPELSLARRNSLLLASQMLGVRKDLSDMMLGVLTLAATLEERGQLQELAKRRAEMDKEFAKLLGGGGAKGASEAKKAEVNELDRRASEFAVHLQALRKQRQAIEQYYGQTRKDQKIPAQQFKHDLDAALAEEESASKEYDKLRADLRDAMAQLDTQGASPMEDLGAQEAQLRKEHADVAERETELMGRLRERLQGAARLRADRLAQALERTAAVDQRLAALAQQVNQALDKRIDEVQARLFAEKENVKGYRQTLATALGETGDVGGAVLSDALRSTAKRFYDIVVRSDVGILDVAWALKQQRTERVSRLVREQKRELKLLDDEFKEVLKKE